MSILITGASGYLGGSLLAQLHDTVLPENNSIYALVRSQEQAEAVEKYGACRCTLKAKRAYNLDWRLGYAPEHIVEAADAEVELILKHM